MKFIACSVLLAVSLAALVSAAPESSHNNLGEAGEHGLEQWLKIRNSKGTSRGTCQDAMMNNCPTSMTSCVMNQCYMGGFCGTYKDCWLCAESKCGACSCEAGINSPDCSAEKQEFCTTPEKL